MYSTKHWLNPDNYSLDWSRRSQFAVGLLTGIHKFDLFELGSGPYFPLKVALKGSEAMSNYLACDLRQWDGDTMVLDLNNSDDLILFRSNVQKITRNTSVFSLLGVIEYLEDVNATLESLKTFCDYLLVSYCCSKNTKVHNSNWQNRYSEKDILGIFLKLNLKIVESQDFEDFEDFNQKIFLLQP